ncbi:MAG: hypothetical protein KBT03_13610 [Bacteroidales bacterium]|nr:hypothetical protein [Candidatus Scybalousia scybalohippi]
MSIKIEQLLPLLKKGWVAMDGNCKWGWYDKKPDMGENFLQWFPNVNGGDYKMLNFTFDIAPVDDWTQSLMRCGNE